MTPKWYSASTPNNIRPVPWMHPAAVAFLETLITEKTLVIEHGCGGSTVWFAHRCNVIAYENDTAWALAVDAITDSVVMRRAPPETPPKCDILLIDGNSDDRPDWILAAPQLVKRGGWVVIDDAERQKYQYAIRKLIEEYSDGDPLAIVATVYALEKKIITLFIRLK